MYRQVGDTEVDVLVIIENVVRNERGTSSGATTNPASCVIEAESPTCTGDRPEQDKINE